MALTIFHAIVTECDCTKEQATRYHMERKGPLLFECYLGETEDQVHARAETFASSGLGWIRVAEVTVNIPGE